MLWSDWEMVTDAIERERQLAEYVKCPVCDGRGDLPGYDYGEDFDCWWCCGVGVVPASDEDTFYALQAEHAI